MTWQIRDDLEGTVQGVGDDAVPGTGGRAPESGRRPTALSPSAGRSRPVRSS